MDPFIGWLINKEKGLLINRHIQAVVARGFKIAPKLQFRHQELRARLMEGTLGQGHLVRVRCYHSAAVHTSGA